MKALVLYASASAAKNTEEIARHIHQEMIATNIETDCFSIQDFQELKNMERYDIVIIGTYTWGHGKIPYQMRELAQYFEDHPNENLVTGIFGSGDTFYPRFCGAVDQFKALLSMNTNLAVTLKVELSPQETDLAKISKFVELIQNRYQL